MGLKTFLHWLNEHDEDQEKRILDALSKLTKADFDRMSDEEIAKELEKLIVQGSNHPKMRDVKKTG